MTFHLLKTSAEAVLSNGKRIEDDYEQNEMCTERKEVTTESSKVRVGVKVKPSVSCDVKGKEVSQKNFFL